MLLFTVIKITLLKEVYKLMEQNTTQLYKSKYAPPQSLEKCPFQC
jgi:hypothetical protein